MLPQICQTILNMSYQLMGADDCSGNSLATNSANLFYDVLPPDLERVIIVSTDQIDLIFDEDINESVAEDESNFSADNGLGQPAQNTLNNDNSARLSIRFANEITPEANNNLTISSLEDLRENSLSSYLIVPFIYEQKIDTILVNGGKSC